MAGTSEPGNPFLGWLAKTVDENWSSRRVFEGIRGHAGRMRSPDFANQVVSFGPYHSCEPDQVSLLIAKHVEISLRLGTELHKHQVDQILLGVLWIHADLIKIHPFLDGNGRTGRLILDFWLGQFGLPPIALQIPRQEYIDVLNYYYDTKDLNPLLRLAMRIYTNIRRRN